MAHMSYAAPIAGRQKAGLTGREYPLLRTALLADAAPTDQETRGVAGIMQQDERARAGLSRRGAIGLLGAAAVAAPGLARAAEPDFPPGAVIRTLLKDYAPQDLASGATLFHEHMSLRDGFMVDWLRHAAETRAATQAPGTPPRPAGQGGGAAGAAPAPNFLVDEDLMADELAIAKREGIGCFVDAGHPDMGRDVGFLRRISQRSGLPVVASAGFYTQPFYPPDIATWSEDKVVDAIMA